MIKLPTLYKQKSKKIMQWDLSIDLKSNPPNYIVSHGYVDGAIQTTSTKVKQGKNTGKKNETTPQEQCELEARALWEKQRDRKGYSENISAEKPVMPILAHKWEDHGSKLKYPLYVQRKLDGCRCLAHIKNGQVKLISRQNKEFILDHITDALKKLSIPDIILDGELFNKDISFRDIISGIKKEGGNSLTKQIEYHVYDIAIAKPYKERLIIIQSLKLQHPIVPVDTYIINSEKEMKQYNAQFVGEGYEGTMIRCPNGIYEFDKRSTKLLKYKHFQTNEYIIVDAHENKGKLVNTCTFTLQTPTGATFEAMPKGTYEERCKYWQDWQGGVIKKDDQATIRYFEYTDDHHMIPRFPILLEVRNYE